MRRLSTKGVNPCLLSTNQRQAAIMQVPSGMKHIKETFQMDAAKVYIKKTLPSEKSKKKAIDGVFFKQRILFDQY